MDITSGLNEPFHRVFAYTTDPQSGSVTSAVITEPFGGTTNYAIDPAADAWTSMTSAEGITTARTLDAAKRQISGVTTGRYSETLGYDGIGNLTSLRPSAPQCATRTHS